MSYRISLNAFVDFCNFRGESHLEFNIIFNGEINARIVFVLAEENH